MEPLNDEIRAALSQDQENLIHWLTELVGFDTSNPPGREGAAQAWIADRLRELDLSVDQWDVLPGRPNVVGLWAGSDHGRSVILNGHVDVAEIRRPELWTYPPFKGVVQGRRLYGRGSSDMKGALAAFYFAIRSLRKVGFRPKGYIIFESVMGEEQNQPGTRSCLEHGYRADFGIVGEDTGGRSIFANIGAINGCVTINAPYTLHVADRIRYMHAGGQREGANVLEKMVQRILPALNELERHWANRHVHPLFPAGQEIINPFLIEGGGNPFVTPDTARLYFTVFYLPTRKEDDVMREVEGEIRRASEADLWLRAHLPRVEWNPGRYPLSTVPSDIDTEHPGTRALMAAHESVLGEPLRIGGQGFASDVGWLFQAGIPSVCYGPGNPDCAHKVDEYVDLDDVIQYAEVIARFLCGWVS
jgi:formylaminopyrimidine deformylase